MARETDGPDAKPVTRTRAEKAFAGEEEFSQSDVSPKRRAVELRPKESVKLTSPALYDEDDPKKD